MTTDKRSIVIVPGATGGSWAWHETADLLRAHGHDVFPVTLTGLGERSHLASADTDLTTHIMDVVNTIKFNELDGRGIVLVGHSYGGMVNSGVAEKVPDGTIAAAVFLDAAVPEDGQSQYDYMGMETPEPDGIFARPLGIDQARSGGRQDVRAARLRTPQPYKTRTEKLRLTGARERIPVLMYVASAENRLWEKRPAVQRVKNDPRWIWRELPCGHDLYALPQEVADLIMEAAGRCQDE